MTHTQEFIPNKLTDDVVLHPDSFAETFGRKTTGEVHIIKGGLSLRTGEVRTVPSDFDGLSAYCKRSLKSA